MVPYCQEFNGGAEFDGLLFPMEYILKDQNSTFPVSWLK